MTPPVALEAKRPKSLATSVVETSVVASAVARALEHECYSARDLQAQRRKRAVRKHPRRPGGVPSVAKIPEDTIYNCVGTGWYVRCAVTNSNSYSSHTSSSRR